MKNWKSSVKAAEHELSAGFARAVSLGVISLGAGLGLAAVVGILDTAGVHAADNSKAWTVVSRATGDLNGDSRPDQAEVRQNGEVSRLVILVRTADGKLQKAAESDTATMLSCGPSGGIPTVTIARGVLQVGQYCGSRQRYDFAYKYQWRNKKWLLIGFTCNTNDANAAASSQKIDINFVTGEVAAGFVNGNKKKSERFLEVRAPYIKAVQPGITDWSVPRIVLRPLTKTAPAIATQAVFNDNQLFIKVECDPPGKAVPNKISLVTADRKTVAPTAVETSAYGYAVARFDRHAPELKAAAAKVTDWSSEHPHQVLRLSLQIDPPDAAPTKPAVAAKPITTARTSTGAILLSKAHEPLTLSDIDVQEQPLPHPFIYPFPED